MQRRAKGLEDSWLLSYADLITNLLLFFVLLLSAAHVSRSKMQQIAKSMSGAESPASLEAIQKEIDAKIKANDMQDVVRTNLTDDGLELSLNSGVVFDPGSAAIKKDVEAAVALMLKTLVPYSTKYNFAVEGHSDSTPLVGGSLFASNWELSSARAIIVRQRLEDVGIDRKRVRVEGYADTKPLVDALLEGLTPEARLARHRRVVVRIY